MVLESIYRKDEKKMFVTWLFRKEEKKPGKILAITCKQYSDCISMLAIIIVIFTLNAGVYVLFECVRMWKFIEKNA